LKWKNLENLVLEGKTKLEEVKKELEKVLCNVKERLEKNHSLQKGG